MVHWSDVYDSYEEYLLSRQQDSQRGLKAARGIMFGLAFSIPMWVLIGWLVW